MRVVVITAALLSLGPGCATPSFVSSEPVADPVVRVPARPGVTVEVPASSVFAAMPAETRATWLVAGGPDEVGLSVRFRGVPVPCTVRGPGDGTLDPADTIVFQSVHVSRDSPYVAYSLRIGHFPGGVRVAGACHRERGDPQPPSRDRYVALAAPGRIVGEPAAAPGARWLAVAPRAWIDALGPLVRLRQALGYRPTTLALEDVYDRLSGGNPDPKALRQAISEVAGASGGSLRWVLLVGDVESAYAPSASAVPPVPAFYARKVPYYEGETDAGEYPTDYQYSVLANDSRRSREGPSTLAVGRVPARTEDEVRGVVGKLVAYEQGEPGGDWRRRLQVYAGPAELGAVADALIESKATSILSEDVPYDFDLDVVFAKPDSPYAYRFDQLGDKILADMNAGALMVAYVGHGAEGSFDDVKYRDTWYEIGSAETLARARIPRGKPLFLTFTCLTGAYDRPGGARSVAEVLAMNPDGPIGVFAASRESHPYTNALYAEAYIDRFLVHRPNTVGEGLLEVKQGMVERKNLMAEAFFPTSVSDLKAEHVRLYNYFGDPATRLRYPDAATLEPSESLLRAGQRVTVDVAAPTIAAGKATVTLETVRATLRSGLVPAGDLDAMPADQAFTTMAANHARAIDKVLSREELPIDAHAGRLTIEAPDVPGDYVIKVYVTGGGRDATGFVRVRVAPPRS